VSAIRTLLIDRIHASRADPSAVTTSVRECLIHYFQAVHQGNIRDPVYQVQIKGTHQILARLSAFHTDDIFFDPHKPLFEDRVKAFFAGVTRHDYPVSIKRLHLREATQALTMGRLQLGGYLQIHHGRHSDTTWVATPCYSGTLAQFAPVFLETPYHSRSSHHGGLRGARYMLLHLLGELIFLHDELHVAHGNISSNNVFVSQRQRRFVLGDPVDFAAPEDGARSPHSGFASDIFHLCLTVIDSMLLADPKVNRAWEESHPDINKPKILFPRRSEQNHYLAHETWHQFFTHCDRPWPRTAAAGLDSHDSWYDRERRELLQRYQNIDAIMTNLDAELWNALCAGLRKDFEDRPTAKVLRQSLTISEHDRLRCAEAWHRIPPYSPAIADEIRRLKPIIAHIP
jgi:hypothetical protein